MPEALYFLRQIGKEKVEVAKFSDGSTSPNEIYLIENSHCNCPGARRGTCKHEKMHDKWVMSGKKPEAFENDSDHVIDLSWLMDFKWVEKLC
jgi:hypothetical protein